MKLSNGQLAVAELSGRSLAERKCRCDEQARAGTASPGSLGANGLTGGQLDRRQAGIRRTSAGEARAHAALLPAGLATRLLDRRARAVALAIDRKLVLLPKHQ